MSAFNYSQLKRHIGHKIVCTYYGKRRSPDNVAIECETCYEVLLDFDFGQDEDSPRCPVCGEAMDLVELDSEDEYWTCDDCPKVDLHIRRENE